LEPKCSNPRCVRHAHFPEQVNPMLLGVKPSLTVCEHQPPFTVSGPIVGRENLAASRRLRG
ncbi:MAG: hypothetical protein L0Y64_26835, partial [Myxococcaceae bacterium]|nr:hypothetical protein [Myxococcaceae bacterium]